MLGCDTCNPPNHKTTMVVLWLRGLWLGMKKTKVAYIYLVYLCEDAVSSIPKSQYYAPPPLNAVHKLAQVPVNFVEEVKEGQKKDVD